MHTMRRPVHVVLCTLAMVAAPGAASAQARDRTEWFAGYSYLLDPGNAVLAVTAGDNAFPLGWIAGGARPIASWMAAAGEISGHYKHKTTFDDDVSLSFHAFMAGPRVHARLGPITEFAQLLAGAAHARGSAFGVTVSSTALSLQPGGGIDYQLRPRLAARLELDYRWIRGAGEGRAHASQFRAAAILVVR